jgi:hypothetical protein
MDAKSLRAGIYAGIVGLLSGSVLGTFGGWSPVLNLPTNPIGVWVLALGLSVALAYIYAYWFASFLPGTAVLRGAIYGVLLWIVLLILGGLTSFFKEAVYPVNSGPVLFLSLVVNIFWGAALGYFAEQKV